MLDEADAFINEEDLPHVEAADGMDHDHQLRARVGDHHKQGKEVRQARGAMEIVDEGDVRISISREENCAEHESIAAPEAEGSQVASELIQGAWATPWSSATHSDVKVLIF